MKILLLPLLVLCLSSCALFTTSAKVVGKAATTTIGIAGKAVGAGVSHLGKDEE